MTVREAPQEVGRKEKASGGVVLPKRRLLSQYANDSSEHVQPRLTRLLIVCHDAGTAGSLLAWVRNTLRCPAIFSAGATIFYFKSPFY